MLTRESIEEEIRAHETVLERTNRRLMLLRHLLADMRSADAPMKKAGPMTATVVNLVTKSPGITVDDLVTRLQSVYERKKLRAVINYLTYNSRLRRTKTGKLYVKP